MLLKYLGWYIASLVDKNGHLKDMWHDEIAPFAQNIDTTLEIVDYVTC